MFTLTLGAMLCFFSSIVGMYINTQYRKRMIVFEQLVIFLDFSMSDITFLKQALEEIINSFTLDKKGEFIKFCNDYVLLLSNGSCNKEEINEILKSVPVKKNERKIICEIFANIGRTDCDNQLNFLTNYLNKVKKLSEYSQKEQKTYGVLSYKLGILVGIVIMIIVM